jgi:hypothetical protein
MIEDFNKFKPFFKYCIPKGTNLKGTVFDFAFKKQISYSKELEIIKQYRVFKEKNKLAWENEFKI